MSIKPHFVFTSMRNSFTVNITNIEKLSVNQIQEIEQFVNFRNGIFNFDTYSFDIHKKLEFHEFDTLLKHIGLDARCEENIPMRESKPRIGFGQYKGMQYNELPDSYMLWLNTNYRGQDRETIDKELKKRNLLL